MRLTIFICALLIMLAPETVLSQNDSTASGQPFKSDLVEKAVERASTVVDQLKADGGTAPAVSAGQAIAAQAPGPFVHPWEEGNPNSEQDWEADSDSVLEGDFWGCFEARQVDNRCDYCNPPAGFFLDEYCLIPFFNFGMTIEYWWPEYEIEINNFGIAAINPIDFGKNEYLREQLIQNARDDFLKQAAAEHLAKLGTGVLGDEDIPEGLKQAPNLGQTHHDGIQTPDQTMHGEGHIYRSFLQHDASQYRTKGAGFCGKAYIGIPVYACYEIGDFWYNGFLVGNAQSCFYDAFDPTDCPIKPWTEDNRQHSFQANLGSVIEEEEESDGRGGGFGGGGFTFNTDSIIGGFGGNSSSGNNAGSGANAVTDARASLLEIWRVPERSRLIAEDFYTASLPFDLTDDVEANIEKIKTASGWLGPDMCHSYRIANWEERYGDLEEVFRIQPHSSNVAGTTGSGEVENDPLDTICYREAGLQLYPLVGSVLNVQNIYAASALLARRSVEIVGLITDNHGQPPEESSGGSGGGFGFGGFGGGGFGGFGGGGDDDDQCYWDLHGSEHVSKFTKVPKSSGYWTHSFKDVDKLQVVHPGRSQCFRISEVDELDGDFFPEGAPTPDANGSIRLVYWNKRQACACEMRGSESAVEFDNGDDECSFINSMNYGWGCQMNPRDHEELDDARGSKIVDEIQGDINGKAKLPASCIYPFDGPQFGSTCYIFELLVKALMGASSEQTESPCSGGGGGFGGGGGGSIGGFGGFGGGGGGGGGMNSLTNFFSCSDIISGAVQGGSSGGAGGAFSGAAGGALGGSMGGFGGGFGGGGSGSNSKCGECGGGGGNAGGGGGGNAGGGGGDVGGSGGDVGGSGGDIGGGGGDIGGFGGDIGGGGGDVGGGGGDIGGGGGNGGGANTDNSGSSGNNSGSGGGVGGFGF